MNKLKQDCIHFLQNKYYFVALLITSLCSYGYEIANPSIGIDDTAVALYLEEGLEVVMGRWTIFWLNKVFHLSDFAPFMTELIGVLFLAIAATLFNVLLYRISNYKSGMLGATIFACMFVSSPIISEVFIYYWHDGVGLGHMLCALALLQFYEAVGQKGKRAVWALFRSLLFLWIAVGCYEAFFILYVLGVLTILFLDGMENKEGISLGKVVKLLVAGALVSVLSIVLRSVMIAITTQLFGLQNVLAQVKQEQRSLSEMFAYFSDAEGRQRLIMLAKRFWLVYHVNAVVYLPVAVYEFAVFLFGGASVVLALKQKKISYPLLFIGMLITPFMLTLAETHVSYYRSCQYLPFYGAAGMWMFVRFLETNRKYAKQLKLVAAVIGLIIVWNQAERSNYNFYIDHMKYENTRDELCKIADKIEQDFGTNKAVVFVGHYNTPAGFMKEYCVPYTSWQYRYIATITDLVDPSLKDKYATYSGYSFAGEANYEFIQWAFDAFDGTNREILKFMEMHGHSFRLVTNEETLAEAQKLAEDMPAWPREGSVVDSGRAYVLVHIEN